jgi:hypothetical protein
MWRVTHSFRCRNEQADHRPRDRGQNSNHAERVAEQRNHGGYSGQDVRPTELWLFKERPR